MDEGEGLEWRRGRWHDTGRAKTNKYKHKYVVAKQMSFSTVPISSSISFNAGKCRPIAYSPQQLISRTVDYYSTRLPPYHIHSNHIAGL